ncbi:MAG: hypothetical protein KAS39_03825, partial [Actinomycetia bacterium]|nr:hypothetical protein [Actinomycetes bacterium]
MKEKIIENGGEIRTRAEVTKIITGKKLATGVVVNGKETIDCDILVASAHPKKIIKLINPKNFTKAYRTRIMDLEESLTGMSFHIKTSKKVTTHGNYNIHRFYQVEQDNIINGPDDFGGKPRMIWYSIPTKRDPEWNEEGDAIYGLYPISYKEVEKWKDTTFSSRPEDYIEFKERQKEIFLDLLKADMPEISGHIEYADVATPLTYEHYINTVEGSFYGIKHNCGQQPPYGVLTNCKV